MFNLLTVQVLAEERVKDALREGETARLFQQVRQRREPQRRWSAVVSFLNRLPILRALPQSAFASKSLPKEVVECLPVGCC